MITRKELEAYARIKGLSLGNAEKDYLIDVALMSISRSIKNELIFKGGTCLYKFYKLNRFSEDLDFTAVQDIDVNKVAENVIADFALFGIRARLHEKREPHNSILITIRAEGPLYQGTAGTAASLGIDVNKKSSVVMKPDALIYRSTYPDIPPITVLCMAREEILAEKIRALMTRERARDLFDVYFLLKQGVTIGPSLIQDKLDYYGKKFDSNALLQRLSRLNAQWLHLKSFTQDLPEFETVKDFVAKALKTAFK